MADENVRLRGSRPEFYSLFCCGLAEWLLSGLSLSICEMATRALGSLWILMYKTNLVFVFTYKYGLRTWALEPGNAGFESQFRHFLAS